MVPSTYDAYFGAVATAAAALIGLLFVASSIRDETLFGNSSARPPISPASRGHPVRRPAHSNVSTSGTRRPR